MRKLTTVIVLIGLAAGAWNLATPGGQKARATVEVTLPAAFSDTALAGRTVFEANCVACHGTDGAGVEGAGPPLVHIIYEPGHHGDEAFQIAVARGVRQHHWPYGNMPPVDGLGRDDVALITAYVRELQQANGIN